MGAPCLLAERERKHHAHTGRPPGFFSFFLIRLTRPDIPLVLSVHIRRVLNIQDTYLLCVTLSYTKLPFICVKKKAAKCSSKLGL